jgi:hypothetical protein
MNDRYVRIIFQAERSLKQQCERIAASHDETLSQVLRRALREYVRANAQMQLADSKARPRRVRA